MKAKVVKTELGWEPAFYQPMTGWTIEPDFAVPTKAAAQAALARDIEDSRRIDAASRSYQRGMDYACGYRD